MNKLPCFLNLAIPTQFDETLSYYEQVCKLTKTVNELITFINGNITDVIEKVVTEKTNEIIAKLMVDAMIDNETLILNPESEG